MRFSGAHCILPYFMINNTGAFAENHLTSVIIPSSVTSIEDWTFLRNHLTSVTIPANVTSIGAEAFLENRLTSVSIPNSVTSIGERAFDDGVTILR